MKKQMTHTVNLSTRVGEFEAIEWSESYGF